MEKKDAVEENLIPEKSRVFLWIILANLMVPLVFVVVGQIYLALFNPYIDITITIPERIALAFRPLIYLLYFALVIVTIFIILKKLSSLFLYLDKGGDYRKARRATLFIPWFLLILHLGAWILATFVFYIISRWKPAGKMPFLWSLIFTANSGLLGGLFTALIINNLLLKIKKALRMTEVFEGERDHFARNRRGIILFTVLFTMMIYIMYTGNFFIIHPLQEGYSRLSGGYPIKFLPAMLIVGSGVALVSMVLHFFSRREYKFQVNILRKELRNLAAGEGDLTSRAVLLNFDEMGELCHSINLFLELFSKIIATIKGVIATTVSISGTLGENVKENRESLSSFSKKMSEISEYITEEEGLIGFAGKQVDVIIEHTASFRENIDGQTRVAADIRSRVDRMLGSFRDLGQNASRTSALGEQLFNKTTAGAEGVKLFYESIEQVKEDARNIKDTIALVSDVADTTNLLALNASIEAAHAGEKGKGFAVVAGEIRKLAEKSAQSANLILGHVNGMFQRLEMSLSRAAQVKKVLEDIFSGIKEINGEASLIAEGMHRETGNSRAIIELLGDFSGRSHRMDELSLAQVSKGEAIRSIVQELERISSIVHKTAETVSSQLVRLEENFSHISGVATKSEDNARQLQELSQGFVLKK